MARKRRIQTPGLIRHVMSRGNGRMCIFVDDTDYQKFLQVLEETIERFNVVCWDYCVMPNHYHAALQPQLPNISDAIRHLNGEYAQWWNRRHSRVGHTFQGRFKGQIVQRQGYLLALSRYLANNPVRAGIVDSPERWQWSSYAATIGLRQAPAFLSTHLVLQQFGDEEPAILQRRFADWVRRTRAPDIDELIRSSSLFVGNKMFKASFATPKTPAVIAARLADVEISLGA